MQTKRKMHESVHTSFFSVCKICLILFLFWQVFLSWMTYIEHKKKEGSENLWKRKFIIFSKMSCTFMQIFLITNSSYKHIQWHYFPDSLPRQSSTTKRPELLLLRFDYLCFFCSIAMSCKAFTLQLTAIDNASMRSSSIKSVGTKISLMSSFRHLNSSNGIQLKSETSSICRNALE